MVVGESSELTGEGGARGPGARAALLLCWLCCCGGSSDTCSSRKHPRRPIAVESGSQRSGDFFSRRMGSSAISLHLPSTSGLKIPLSAHRSHEEIRRRKSHHEPNEETRYYSAPSVIDEVIHRRDWDRSSKDLYIPLKPQTDCNSIKSNASSSSDKAPCAEPESSSIECLKPEEPKCKKHHKNIKSSKGKKCKESNKDDIKDMDATEVEVEVPNFYIGDAKEEYLQPENCDLAEHDRLVEEKNRSMYKAKDAKQSFNESIKLKDFPRGLLAAVEEGCVIEAEFRMDEVVDGIDRSGAMHHTIESRLSFSRPYPPPSVEAVGYEGGACYLAEVGTLTSLRARAGEGVQVEEVGAGGGAMRARHASDGDILAPMHRPESGAFSESDLDIDMEALASEDRPPAYHEIHLCDPYKRETAI